MVERDTKTHRAALRQKAEGGNGLGVVDWFGRAGGCVTVPLACCCVL
jgi:hypothetical protein